MLGGLFDVHEIVYMVWDLYDGPRSGIANFDGEPHYFRSISDPSGGYTDSFQLFPVNRALLSLASEQWNIYREWERKFHSGSETPESHPGHGGIHARYDEIEAEIDSALRDLSPRTGVFGAEFRQLVGQPDLPFGCLRELEVQWITRA
jgi:hypothetical protein